MGGALLLCCKFACDWISTGWRTHDLVKYKRGTLGIFGAQCSRVTDGAFDIQAALLRELSHSTMLESATISTCLLECRSFYRGLGMLSVTNMAIVGVTIAAVEADSWPPAVTSLFFFLHLWCINGWMDGRTDGCGYSRCLGLIFWNAKKERCCMFPPLRGRFHHFLTRSCFALCWLKYI